MNSAGFHGPFIKPSPGSGTLGADETTPQEILMKPPVANLAKALGLIVLGVAFAAGGIYVGETDDAPGAALLGFLLMIGLMVLAVKTARRKT
jgi:hypothetical protein